MSFLFLQLSFLTYFACHHWAKKTTPERSFSFGQLLSFKGSVDDFEKDLIDWVNQQPRLNLIEKKTGEWIVHHGPRLFSYGYYYHIQSTQKEKGLEIVFCVQPKLVSLPRDRKMISDEFSEALNLKNVS
ncbi:MAG: hypothetical protein HRT44_05515 [Bdellovibrionales bacterium]|nr:hypothetical protein [Bdellovibrionales bacterium]NQZ18701.1 hypothetical protein [Bdellovibrionales bacterium]